LRRLGSSSMTATLCCAMAEFATLVTRFISNTHRGFLRHLGRAGRLFASCDALPKICDRMRNLNLS
jgi:hypothetical protein